MLFLNYEKIKKYGGSDFIEIQFCDMPHGTSVKEITAIDNIKDNNPDSLYICDDNTFYHEYSRFFDCGTYNNLKTGPVDIYGINYYAPHLTDLIIEKITKEKTTDYEALTQWLQKSKSHNGFYILGY